jgi:L-lactate permease
VFGGTQFLISNFVGAQLTDILSSLAAMVALTVTYRVWKPRTGKQDYASFRGAASANDAMELPAAHDPSTATRSEVLFAWVPYALLVVCVLLWGYGPYLWWMNTFSMLLPWPMLHDHVLRVAPVMAKPAPYHAIFTFNYLSASGTSCMVATLLSALVLRIRPMAFVRLLFSVGHQLMLPILTCTSVLAMAFLMNYSGATATLGIAFAATGVMFPFFSALLGWVGVFLTGSDTSANALFGNLQVVTADHLHLNPALMAATNSSGGVMGKMISLQTIAVAAAATGMNVQDQARLFRFTLKHSILLAGVIGGLALLYAYVLHI